MTSQGYDAIQFNNAYYLTQHHINRYKWNTTAYFPPISNMKKKSRYRYFVLCTNLYKLNCSDLYIFLIVLIINVVFE